jgi:hypothetical protein
MVLVMSDIPVYDDPVKGSHDELDSEATLDQEREDHVMVKKKKSKI